MNATIGTSSNINLSPLPRASTQRSEQAPSLPVDEMVRSQAEVPGLSWGKVGLLALGVVAGAAGCASSGSAPAQQVQSQPQTQSTSLLENYTARQPGQTHYYVHLGIIGRDVEVTRDQALENINSGHDVILRTEVHSPITANNRTVDLPRTLDTHVDSPERLEQMLQIQSRAGQVSQTEVEHVTKVLSNYSGVQGDFFYQIKEVEYNDGAGAPQVKSGELSPFEAASEILQGKEVAFSAIPVSQVVEARAQGRSLDSLRGEVHTITDQDDLLSLPPSFDAAREVWHPRIPGTGGPIERCFKTEVENKVNFECESIIVRGAGGRH